jgi:WD40 repeat protein
VSKLATGAYHGSVCIFKRDPDTLDWHNTHLLRADDPQGLAAKRNVEWSPDNNLLAVGSDDSMVYVYDFRGGEPVEVVAVVAHDSACRHVSFDPTSTYVVSSGDRSDPTILIRQVDNSQNELRVALHTNQVRTITWIASFSTADGPSSATVASAGDGGVIRVLEIQRAGDGSLSLSRSLELGALQTDRYASLAWGAEAGLLAAGDTYGFVTLWGMSNNSAGEWSMLYQSAGHTAAVDKLQWLGSTLVTGAKDLAMGIVEVNHSTKEVVRTYKTDVDCRRPFAVDDGIVDVPRVVCLRGGSSAAGNKWSDTQLPVTIEVETVLVGFDYQYSLFQRMVYGRLSLADLSALGYQDLTRIAS